MSTHHTSVPLPGSARPRPSGSRLIQPLNAAARVHITLLIRSRPGSPPLPDLEHWQKTPPHERRFLSPEQFAETWGATEADLDAVTTFVTGHGMRVLERGAGTRSVSVEGTAAQMHAAFGVKLNDYESPLPAPPHRGGAGSASRSHVHYGYDGAVHVPHELSDIITAVVGLDNRSRSAPLGSGDPPGAALVSVPTIAALYNFPNSGAASEVVGVIALDGAAYNTADINSYIASLPSGYQTQPTVVDVPLTVGTTTYTNDLSLVAAVPLGQQKYTGAYGSILEVTQDISTIAAVAQGATINVYFTEDSEQGWLVFLSRLLQPGTERQPSVVSCSYWLANSDRPGFIGDVNTPGSLTNVMSGMFQQLATQGITVFVGAGDYGADNGFGDGATHANYPATEPWATSCGATIVGNGGAAPLVEYVWSDANTHTAWFDFTGQQMAVTGGGASLNFPLPAYQTAAGITQVTDSSGNVLTKRIFPDVAGMAAYDGFVVNGSSFEWWGTSCVAPLYAGLMAVLHSAFHRRVGFLNPTLYALGGTVCNDVTQGNNQSYTLPNKTPAPYFTAGPGFDACSGWGSIDGTRLLDGIARLMYTQSFYFVVDKSTYGLDEVGNVASYPSALWLVLDGFAPSALGGAAPSVPAGAPSGMTITVGAAQPEMPQSPNTPQRILFPCTVAFAAAAIQPKPNGVFPASQPPLPVALSSTMTVQGHAFSASASLELLPGANPYFVNINPQANNVFYLSQDLRVFTVTPGQSNQPLSGAAGAPTHTAAKHLPYDANAGFQYIKDLIAFLNTHYNDPAGTDPFTFLPNQSAALSAVSSIAPNTVDPASATGARFASYSYGIARVRLDGATPNAPTAKNVRVLFRLFATETSDTDYTHDHYPSTLDAAGNPLSPTPGTQNVTLPFFATGNYEANQDFGLNADYSANSVNNQPMQVGASGSAWAWYGCYLNVYTPDNTIGGTSVPTMLPGTHHCLVAQISSDDAPIVSSAGINASPQNSDKLAQRNLEITLSDNPGPRDTHRVPQTFDLRPSPALATSPGQLLDYPDELMIDWGNTPAGSVASIYWPQVRATEVLALADKLYSTRQLTLADAHTITCRAHRGFTYIPIPPDSGDNFAGLFTVDLPLTVVTGQQLAITVRRIATRRVGKSSSTHTDGGGGASGKSKPGTMPNWRYVVGTFGVHIPVTTASVMLPVEQNVLANMRWRLAEMQAHNRWVPVLRRYISYLEARVDGLGGHSKAVEPSPYGTAGPVGKRGGR